jgi:hypothetical protein
VTPQVFIRVINPNDRVIRVDFGQTTVNLGHHLENITNNPLMTLIGQPLVKLVKTPKTPFALQCHWELYQRSPNYT